MEVIKRAEALLVSVLIVECLYFRRNPRLHLLPPPKRHRFYQARLPNWAWHRLPQILKDRIYFVN